MSTALQDFLSRETDEQVAKELGYQPRTVAAWRRGERLPRPAAWQRIQAYAPHLSYEATINWKRADREPVSAESSQQRKAL